MGSIGEFAASNLGDTPDKTTVTVSLRMSGLYFLVMRDKPRLRYLGFFFCFTLTVVTSQTSVAMDHNTQHIVNSRAKCAHAPTDIHDNKKYKRIFT